MFLTTWEWAEIVFNILYLIVIFSVVIYMYLILRNRKDQSIELEKIFADSFLLLAIGDLLLILARILAYMMGGLDQTVKLFNFTVPFVGLGNLAQSITMTFFYILIMEVYRLKKEIKPGFLYFLVIGLGVIRLGIFFVPQNRWSDLNPPADWVIIRNIPLVLMSLVAGLSFLLDSLKKKDLRFTWIAVLIMLPLAFYLPSQLIEDIPEISLLMIPRSLCFLAALIVGFKALKFTQKQAVKG